MNKKIIEAIENLSFVEIINVRKKDNILEFFLESIFRLQNNGRIGFYLLYDRKPYSDFEKFNLVAEGFRTEELTYEMLTNYNVRLRDGSIVKYVRSLKDLDCAIAQMIQVLTVIDEKGSATHGHPTL